MTRVAVSCLAVVLVGVAGSTQPRSASPRDVLERAYQSNNTGAAWLERLEYAKAAAAFREALRLVPTLAAARFNLALALHYDGKPDEAEREARAAAPGIDTPHADYLRGLIAKGQGQTATAATAFARVLQRDPYDAAAGIAPRTPMSALACAPCGFPLNATSEVAC